MTALWTSGEADAATGGRSTRDWVAYGISIDTRTIARGDLFVALPGERVDGHDYVKTALAGGAAAALVSRRPAGVAADAALLEVPETLAGLTRMAAAARARSGAKVAAVTGSVGKTGTKDALALVLGDQGATHANAGNLNNHIGAPLSLARMPAATDYAVFELGMNHAGEIAPLSQLVRPHAAVITTVAPAHLEYFPDEAAIADEKATVMDGLEPGGTAVLNRDNPHFDRLRDHADRRGVGRVLSFGTGAGADYRAADIAEQPDGSLVTAAIAGRTLRYRVGAPGRHWAINSLAVLAAATALGADLDRAAASLAKVRPPKGRGAQRQIRVGGGTITLIDESYNASPIAVRAAIAVLAGAAPGPGGRRIFVLGDMLELGPDAAALHAGLADALAPIDLVFTAGPLSAALHAGLPAPRRGAHAVDAAALAPVLAAALRPGDVVTVKGSLGSRMAQVVTAVAALDAEAR